MVRSSGALLDLFLAGGACHGMVDGPCNLCFDQVLKVH